jgi:hypothetical protein
MRWLVEVTSLGKTEKDSLYVDADSWQKALQVARSLRGESEPLSGFSIELLDEGCRAVDPVSRMSYEVHRAPEDGRSASTRPSTAPPPPVAPRPASPAVAAPQAPQPPQALVSPQAVAPKAVAPKAVVPSAEPPPRSRPSISAAATMMIGPKPAPVAASAAPVGPPVETASAFAARAVISNLPSQVVFKREQDATEALPLTYREYVYVVPPGSTEAAATTLVHSQFDLVRASLDRMPAGKLVNLAVFDMTFQGKPPVPPLATLVWKDWRGSALVSFPRQPARAPVPIPTAPITLPPPHAEPVHQSRTPPPL